MQMYLGPGGATTSACLIVGKVHTELMFASGPNSVYHTLSVRNIKETGTFALDVDQPVLKFKQLWVYLDYFLF